MRGRPEREVDEALRLHHRPRRPLGGDHHQVAAGLRVVELVQPPGARHQHLADGGAVLGLGAAQRQRRRRPRVVVADHDDEPAPLRLGGGEQRPRQLHPEDDGPVGLPVLHVLHEVGRDAAQRRGVHRLVRGEDHPQHLHALEHRRGRGIGEVEDQAEPVAVGLGRDLRGVHEADVVLGRLRVRRGRRGRGGRRGLAALCPGVGITAGRGLALRRPCGRLGLCRGRRRRSRGRSGCGSRCGCRSRCGRRSRRRGVRLAAGRGRGGRGRLVGAAGLGRHLRRAVDIALRRHEVDDVGLVLPEVAHLEARRDRQAQHGLARVGRPRQVADIFRQPVGQRAEPHGRGTVEGDVEARRVAVEMDVDRLVRREDVAPEGRQRDELRLDLHLFGGRPLRRLARQPFRLLGAPRQLLDHLLRQAGRDALPVGRQEVDVELLGGRRRADLHRLVQGEPHGGAVRVAPHHVHVARQAGPDALDREVDGLGEGDHGDAAGDLDPGGRDVVLEGQHEAAVAVVLAGRDRRRRRVRGARRDGEQQPGEAEKQSHGVAPPQQGASPSPFLSIPLTPHGRPLFAAAWSSGIIRRRSSPVAVKIGLSGGLLR